jgi:two-component system, sensor histidine kinase and response regulator
MDWQMPEMDGLEATRRIRQLPAMSTRIPVIALTANANAGFREACLAAGANDYLSKPYTEAALAALLMQWLPHAGAIGAAPAAARPAGPACTLPRQSGSWSPNWRRFSVSTTEASLAALKRANRAG